MAAEGGRTARKRKAIMDAATEVFLQHGYLGASMDEVAARAAVSKQTVYKHFADKQRLFAEILDGTVGHRDELDQTIALALRDSGDLAADLGELARWLLDFLTRPEVRRLRRLVIGEAGRFPGMGRGWYERGFSPAMAALADAFRELARRGSLRLDDPELAANHFAGLVLWAPVNRVMFCGDDEQLTGEEFERYVAAGVRAFLAAYAA
jgi:TetR/AcrR family transcriptional regulator, mexJK operon transcriptional repressor